MARAYRFTIIRIPAPTLEKAPEVVRRLTGTGIPRRSMNSTPHKDDSYHVAVHTREANRKLSYAPRKALRRRAQLRELGREQYGVAASWSELARAIWQSARLAYV